MVVVVIQLVVVVLVVEHVQFAQTALRRIISLCLYAQHIEVQVASLIHADSETLRTAVSLRLGVLWCHVVTYHRYQTELEVEADGLHVHLVLLFIRAGTAALVAFLALGEVLENLSCYWAYDADDAESRVRSFVEVGGVGCSDGRDE